MRIAILFKHKSDLPNGDFLELVVPLGGSRHTSMYYCSQDTRAEVQVTLVDLLLSIKALPMDTLVEKLGQVMKRPPNTDHQTNAKVSGSGFDLIV